MGYHAVKTHHAFLMFILHSSNKTENLLIHLITVIDNAPLSNPLEQEVFLIQSQGMERWLAQQLASHFGVWGNYQFLFPGRFFSDMAKKVDQQLNDELFNRDLMLWRFEQLLCELDGADFAPLVNYLQGENPGLKRFQLAQQLANLFDQYQMMRPDMLDSWQRGELCVDSSSEKWQQLLWQKLALQLGNKHRGMLWQQAIDRFNQTADLSAQISERIFVFGVNTMPPMFLQYLQAISNHCDVHLFLLNPAQVYWADVASKRQLQQQSSDDHPLLSALAQQGREFQQMLLEQTRFNFEPESFQPVEASSNLHQLQNDLLNNQLQTQILTPDDSISIHACHSRMREVQVLKDQLLAALERDDSLQLRDIVVMAPDIQLYAPFINTVFSDIQHAIADKSLRLSNSLLDSFIRFLKLSQGRFGWQSVLDLLQQSVVYGSFDLSEADLELIKHWVAETHVRWGKSAEHKKQLGLPALNENTWQAMLDRLFIGYAAGDEEDFIADVLPYAEIEGSTALLLGGLNDFMQVLFKASEELSSQCKIATWGTRLQYYVDQLFSNQAVQQKESQELNELLIELSDSIPTVHQQAVSLDVIIAWLETRVSEQKTSTGFLRGQLTFCSMLPMRSIPFKVIALMGLNEGEFPKLDRQPSFDLLAQHFRAGDRSRRADDRYQFLEVLLSTRQQLIISYIGLSIQQNEVIPPSVVISELLDVLENNYQLSGVVKQHPLQPFSSQYFIQGEGLFSYSQNDYEIMLALQGEKKTPDNWWQGSLKTDEPEIIEISELFRYFRQPQHYFLQQLGIRLQAVDCEVEEREPFELSTLDSYIIQQQWVADQLADQSFSLQKLQARGEWPVGAVGELIFQQQQKQINEFATLVQQQQLGDKIQDQAIDINLGYYRLVGSLGYLYQHGGMIYRYAKLKGKDFIQAWLHHLLINLVHPQDTCLISSDQMLVFSQTQAEKSKLEKLLDIYLQGRQQPNAFFTEASFAYIRQETNSRARSPAIDAAIKKLSQEQEYDNSLCLLYQNINDLSEILNQDFEHQCQELLLPVWVRLNSD